MPSTIRVDSGFRSRRIGVGAAVDKALPHRRSYLGFALGLIATVVVALTGLAWWLIQSGVISVQINL